MYLRTKYKGDEIVYNLTYRHEIFYLIGSILVIYICIA